MPKLRSRQESGISRHTLLPDKEDLVFCASNGTFFQTRYRYEFDYSSVYVTPCRKADINVPGDFPVYQAQIKHRAIRSKKKNVKHYFKKLGDFSGLVLTFHHWYLRRPVSASPAELKRKEDMGPPTIPMVTR